MKVIVDNYSSNTCEVICPQCESILEIDRNDIKYDNDGDAYVECPLCGRTFYLSDKIFKKLIK